MTHNPKQIDAATAMMLAAEYVEQDGRFDFRTTAVPTSCSDKGCALGWVAFVAGVEPAPIGTANRLNPVANWLGYESEIVFYSEMHRSAGYEWTRDPALAATGLRKLAQERMQ